MTMLLLWLLYGPQSAKPKVTPPVPHESIPYCPTKPFGQPQMYLPCMYSSLEKSA